ncbi:MAG: SDR family NAD(P)-dependent oxidoreductase [Spirochaetaceae bacterium]|jgi:short-subunit dehydrogenase|nr:SDR family NAD(P)-dependent oxidoreductase [Spirochaetaceae bacterium]
MKKIVIITGASSGMGAEFARQLAGRKGIDEIWLMARRKERLEDLARELGRPERLRIIPGDISGRKGGDLTARQLKDAGGIVVDTVVNNAGFGVYGPFTGTNLQKQLDMIDLNVQTLTAITGAVLPYLAPGSRVINVASLAAFSAMGNFAVYAATKAYVLSFSLGLAAELEPAGIPVIALCPGPVDTEFSAVASGGVREKVLHGKPAKAVVAHCLACLERGKPIAVMSPKWKLKAFLPRLVSRLFAARFTLRHEARPSGFLGETTGGAFGGTARPRP